MGHVDRVKPGVQRVIDQHPAGQALAHSRRENVRHETVGDDLELESIEFVALAEALQNRYGAQVDFVSWISQKELDEIIDLTVGDVVQFISECLS